MVSFAHVLRDARQILFRNAEQHAIPSMDGGMSPNDALDRCRPIGDALPGADDVAEAPDGALYVSAGPRVLRLSGPGYESRAVVAEFDHNVGGLACHPDGRILACVAERGLAAIDRSGRQHWLGAVEGEPLRCLTGVVATADGAVFACDGSKINRHEDWCRDLMQRNNAGRLIVCGPELDEPRVLLRDLHYPQGLAVAPDGRFLWLSESWSHQVSRAALDRRGSGAPEVVIRNLPGYPARPARAAAGGFWLSIFALRTHLIEFVLREDDFRAEMMRTIAPEHWIAPALATRGDPLEPMQNGSIKALGIQKPWAPPRSYGLVVRIDDQGEAVESLHSRVGGRYHGITAACETAQGLVIVSQGAGCVLLAARGGRS